MKGDHELNGINCIIRKRRKMIIPSSSSSWMALVQDQYLKQFCSILVLNRQRIGSLGSLPCHMVKMVADRALATVSLSSSSSSHFEWASHLLSKTNRLDSSQYLDPPSSLSYARKKRRTTSTRLRRTRRKSASSIIRQMHASTHYPKAAADDDDAAAAASAKLDMWKKLQTLIPGGNGMEPLKLLKEMAHYIIFLQMQYRSLNHLLTALSA